jgi:quinol monooxygenase YgiN
MNLLAYSRLAFSSLRDSMTDTPIIINAHIQAAPGHEKELGNELHALVAPSRKETGVLVYELHVDPERSGKFMFYEKFASQAVLDSHLASPHFEKFQSYLKAKGNPIAEQTVTRWQSLD